jgi:hypothetical protein
VATVVPPLLRPPPHPHQVGEEAEAVARGAHRRALGVLDRDWHLGEGEPVALDQVEDLDVEREPVDPARREDEVGDVGPERLQAALRVAVLTEEQRVRGHVDHPAAHKRWHGADHRVRLTMAIAGRRRPTRPRRAEQAEQLHRRMRGRRHRRWCGPRGDPAAWRPLAAVDRAHDLIGACNCFAPAASPLRRRPPRSGFTGV